MAENFKRAAAICFLSISFCCSTNASIMLTEVNANFVPLILGESRWADINGDGHLDLMICGQSRANGLRREFHTYLGNGAGGFSEINSGLPAISSGTFDLADIDGDNDLDVAIAGLSFGGFIGLIYKNDGSGNFVAAQPFDQSGFQSIHFGDYDADGDPDLLVSASAVVLRNSGGLFQPIKQLLFPFETGTSNFIDIDLDGKFEIAQSGIFPGNPLITGLIWRQTNEAEFVQLPGNFRPMLDRSEIQVRDANCDGFPDMLFGEAYNGVNAGAVYRNNGDLSFTEEPFDIVGAPGNSGFIDLDGDEIPEVLLTGFLRPPSPSGIATDAFRRVGGKYQLIRDLVLPGFRSASINAVDFDRDGDEDLFMIGDYSSGSANDFSERAVLFRNDTPQIPRCVRSSIQPIALPSNDRVSLAMILLIVLLTGIWRLRR
jgi:FG-GAP-like repeat